MSEHKEKEGTVEEARETLALHNQQAQQENERAEKERKRCCLRCSWFAGDIQNIGGGACHFNPPAVFPMQGPRGVAWANAWPPVHATIDWCGHFSEHVSIKIANSLAGLPRES